MIASTENTEHPTPNNPKSNISDEMVIYWSRRDFRINDNPALTKALLKSSTENIPFLPIFILEDYMVEADPKFQFGYPSRFFLTQALPLFAEKFKQFSIIQSKGAQFFIDLLENNPDLKISIFVNEDIYSDFYKQIEKLEKVSKNNNNLSIEVCQDMLTINRYTKTGQGDVYSIFTPFKNAVWGEFVNASLIKTPKELLSSVQYANLNILLSNFKSSKVKTLKPETEKILNTFSKQRTIILPGVSSEIQIDLHNISPLPNLHTWYWSEEQALEKFKVYLHDGGLAEYKDNRDSLEQERTSKMSLALAWGLVSARMLVALIKKHFDFSFNDSKDISKSHLGGVTYISELIWREFYKYLFFHYPELMTLEFQKKFRGTIKWIPHKEAEERFIAWIKGETGYPIVDAAMKQLAHTGWMHNRARMIVASVLTKNLGVDWKWGQEYFRATLIDLDESSNNGGWQWGASVGADPKPIRVFNPYLQADNFDASEVYRKKWLGQNWKAEYENKKPIVDHKDAREDALKRYGLKRKES